MTDNSFPFDGMGLDPEDQKWLRGWFSCPEGQLTLTLECEAYIVEHYANFTAFAHQVLGDFERARQVAISVLTEIAVDWDAFTLSPDLAAGGLERLVEEVVVEAHGMGRAQVLDDLATEARTLLHDLRLALDEPDADTEVGLYRTLRLLPPRQFAILMLKAHGCSSAFIAWFLQTHPSTIDRNFNRAKAYVGGEMQLRRLLRDAPSATPARTRRHSGATP
ncbi:hypothetical protein [Streptacidiphilus carbonis]|jgi:hypothetical protein|uniref:hypothetical protein n=1 Tax=Streptacidiphilus carbonis TaxID=105422 RepID=UPI0005AA54E3|nr:hypothetical protein [Streptacidiphilus carbonis]